MSAGVTGVCVMSSALPASPSRFPQIRWSERLGAIQFIIYRRFG